MKTPTVLTIAGSDSSGGAGIQADIKTFAALKVHGLCAITAVTAQDPLRVRSVHQIPPEAVAAQIDAVAADPGIDSAKTGMLPSPATVSLVASKIREHALEKVVVDPVLASHGGDPLASDDALEVLRRELLPLAFVVTPNLPEAARLTGREDPQAAAREILAMGARAVVVKGGHAPDPANAVDLLLDRQGFVRLSAPRVPAINTHGGGCTFAAAIAAYLALGEPLRDAVARAKEFVTFALRRSTDLGVGHFAP